MTSVPPLVQPSTSAGTLDGSSYDTFSTSMAGQVQSKKDQIFKNMEHLETKNAELEQKLDTRSAGESVISANGTHSSPKRSHWCNSLCSTHHGKKRRTQVLLFSSQDSSDEDFQPSRFEHSSRYSSSHVSRYSIATDDHVSMDFLNNYDQVQQKVQHPLQDNTKITPKKRSVHSSMQTCVKSLPIIHRMG